MHVTVEFLASKKFPLLYNLYDQINEHYVLKKIDINILIFLIPRSRNNKIIKINSIFV